MIEIKEKDLSFKNNYILDQNYVRFWRSKIVEAKKEGSYNEMLEALKLENSKKGEDNGK